MTYRIGACLGVAVEIAEEGVGERIASCVRGGRSASAGRRLEVRSARIIRAAVLIDTVANHDRASFERVIAFDPGDVIGYLNIS